MICGLSCDFGGRGSERLLDRGAPVLTVADPCFWHGCGTDLSRRQSATTAGAPTDKARVCLAVPPSASTTLSIPSTRASYDGRNVLMVPEPSAWEAAGKGCPGASPLDHRHGSDLRNISGTGLVVLTRQIRNSHGLPEPLSPSGQCGSRDAGGRPSRDNGMS